MLAFLSQYSDLYGPLNIFTYITFRTGGATLTALLISFLFGPWLIRLLKKKQKRGQPIREDGPASHIITKAGTPTMGGLLILLSFFGSVIFWGNFSNGLVWIVLFVTISFGLVGFVDDYHKVTSHRTDGLSLKLRLVIELCVSCFAVSLIMAIYTASALHDPGGANLVSSVTVPIFKDAVFNLGWLFIPFGACVIIGSGNSVNLTDGLDGLAIVPVMIACGAFGMITYLSGRADYTEYLQILHVPGSGELAVLCGAVIGAGLGFLWYNAPPAQIFMGDTGSLSLGALIGTIAIASKQELVLLIIGGLFVLEAVSVFIQVISFKLTGKRVFRMAPIHHHFEHLGWSESQIVMRFWIIAFVLALIGLSTLKLR